MSLTLLFLSVIFAVVSESCSASSLSGFGLFFLLLDFDNFSKQDGFDRAAFFVECVHRHIGQYVSASLKLLDSRKCGTYHLEPPL